MTTEAAVTKLMWALGQTDDVDEVRKIFNKNLAGEVSIQNKNVKIYNNLQNIPL